MQATSNIDFFLTALKKPNSIKEWNDLISQMLTLNHSDQTTSTHPTNEIQDLTTFLKLRNRRIRLQGHGQILKNWTTANAELYLRCS